MKRRLIILALMIVPILGFAYQGGHPGHSSNDMDRIMDQIFQRLNILEADYLSQLNKKENARSRDLLNEIRGLLALMPPEGQPKPQPPKHNYRKKGMSAPDFEALLNSVKKSIYSDDRLNVLKLAAADNRFSVGQIVEMIGLFMYTDDKLDVLAIMYPQCVDKGNKFKILDSFMYGSDKDKAVKIMTGEAQAEK
jgi:hypothetical protein